MAFKEIIGQKSAIAFLKSAYQAKRLAHAYLFMGPQGVGKRKCALSVAQLLVCEDGKQEEPCGVCPSCQKVAFLNHPDVQWIEPENSTIKIDSIRQAQRRLQLRSYEASWKVLIIDQAQLLGDEASNALLKTLEEPLGDSVLILIVDSAASVLPTIVSRCQKVVFLPLGEDVLEDYLLKEHGIDRHVAHFLSRFSEGSLGQALSDNEKRIYQDRLRLMDYVFNKKYSNSDLEIFEKKTKGSNDFPFDGFLRLLSCWYRDILMSKLGLTNRLIHCQDKGVLSKLGARFSFNEIESRLLAIAGMRTELNYNANFRVSFSHLRTQLWK